MTEINKEVSKLQEKGEIFTDLANSGHHILPCRAVSKLILYHCRFLFQNFTVTVNIKEFHDKSYLMDHKSMATVFVSYIKISRILFIICDRT